MPMEIMEKMILNKVKRKYKNILPLYAFRYWKILEYCFIENASAEKPQSN